VKGWRVGGVVLLLLAAAAASAAEPIRIGSRRELFVDDCLIENLRGARLRLHRPTPREVSLERNKPWEGNVSGYTTVFTDGALYRMYYRGTDTIYTQGKVTSPHREVVCYAESRDGIDWTRPELGLVEFEGSKQNNILWDGPGSHNFTPFRDTRPDCPPEARYKAFGSGGGAKRHGLYAFRSADGIHWEMLSEEPVIAKGAFDSQNVGFRDAERGEYRAYVRDFRDGRDIRTCTSSDFVHWSEPVFVSYQPGRVSQLYTNGVIPYYRAPHIFLGFPTRYVDRGWTPSVEQLPQPEYRRLVASSSRRSGTAVTDGMFMASRDGLHFRVWPESFIRPGLRTRDAWFYGDNYQNWGLVETASSIPGAPDEISVYVSEAGRQVGGNRLRRFTIRVDGFVSVEAPLSGGELLTRPLVFEGRELEINFSTSAAGSVRVELQHADGTPVEGLTLAECPEIFGDALGRVVGWAGGSDLGKLAGTPVRLRFVLQDADLYSFRFTSDGK
jgi:hypothetical protein